MSLIYLHHSERVVSKVDARLMSFASFSPPPMWLHWRQAVDNGHEQAVEAMHNVLVLRGHIFWRAFPSCSSECAISLTPCTVVVFSFENI